MRNFFSKFISGLIIAVVMCALTATVLFSSVYMNSQKNYNPIDYKIIVEKELNLKIGQKYQLSPYLINADNEVEDGQYEYKSSNINVVVNDKGLIEVKDNPYKTCYIDVKDINHNISAQIKIEVKEGIMDVFDITSIDGGTISYQDICEYKVDFLPADADLKKFISYEVYDANNQLVSDVFDFKVEKNVAKFRAKGLGRGKLVIKVISEDDYVNYAKDFNFNIILSEESLTNDITNNSLLNESEILQLDHFTFKGTSLNVDELSVLPNLRHIIFENNEILVECQNTDSKYLYHIKENIFLEYFHSVFWYDFQLNLVPYKNKPLEDKYVAFVDSKNLDISIKEVDDSFEFKTVNYVGYLNNGRWSLDYEDFSPVITKEEIFESTDNCIWLFSVWDPITYYLEFHSTINNDDYNGKDNVLSLETGSESQIECKYDTKTKIYNITNFSHQDIVGYIFVGWMKDATKTTIVRSQEELDKITYKLENLDSITVENLSTSDNEVLKYYDVWRPIKYSVKFNIPTSHKKEFSHIPETIDLFYDDIYYLHGSNQSIKYFEGTGYNIEYWAYSNKEFYPDNAVLSKLSIVNDSTISLTPHFVDKSYNIEVRLPEDGNLSHYNSNEFISYHTSILYSQSITSTSLIWRDNSNSIIYDDLNFDLNPGNIYRSYNWFIDLNLNGLYDTQEPTFDQSNFGGSNLLFTLKSFNSGMNYNNIDAVYKNKFVIYPKGISSGVNLTVDLNGAKSDLNDGVNGIYVDVANLNLNYTNVIKEGYTSNGWEIYKNGVLIKTLSPGDLLIYKNFIRDYEVQNLGNGATLLIKALWTPNNYIGQFITNGGTTIESITLPYLSDVAKPKDPTKTGYSFGGWYKDSSFTQKFSFDNLKMPLNGFIVYAKWIADKYTIIFNTNGGSSVSNITADYQSNISAPSNPTKKGYTFDGWYKDSNFTQKFSFNNLKMPLGGLVLYAKWNINSYRVYFDNLYDCTVTIEDGNKTYTIKANEDGDSDSLIINGKPYSLSSYDTNTKDGFLTFNYGTTLKISFSFRLKDDRSYSISKVGGDVIKSWSGDDSSRSTTYTMENYHINIGADSNTCFVEGTKILMGDMTYKNVEDIKPGDMIATWNFFEGKFEAQPVALYWNHGSTFRKTLKLNFSNGNTVEIVGEHGFFSVDENDFVQLNTSNYESYIGKQFISFNSDGVYEKVTLLSGIAEEKRVNTYSLLSAFNGNAIAYNMLTITREDYKGIYTLKFEIDENLKFKQESIDYYVDLYGLYTYEEWSEYFTAEQFYALNGQYYKILVGRGYLTEEDIYTLIEGIAATQN